MPPRNPFTVLGVPLDATADAIKAAWRRLAREHHPDVTARDVAVERRANREMAEINAAYQELRDPVKRRKAREAAARDARDAGRDARPASGHAEGSAGGRGDGAGHDGDGASWAGHGEDGRGGYGEPTDWVPRSHQARPVTGRIDTSSIFHPRNTVLHPLSRSPLPGLPPRPRDSFHREEPRASDPTGPTLREQGSPDSSAQPSLSEALETRLRFGKFEGRTLGEVAALEPSYVAWIVRTIGRDPELLIAARVVQRYLERTRTQRRSRLDSSTTQLG